MRSRPPTSRLPSERIDFAVVSAACLGYFALAVALLPFDEMLRAIVGGLFVFGVVLSAARAAGRGDMGFSILWVGFPAAGVLMLATFAGDTPVRSNAVLLMILIGMQAAVLLWSALRWVAPPRHMVRTALLPAVKRGLGVALVLSLVATVPIVLLLMIDEPGSSAYLLVYPGYFAGSVAAACVYWALQGIAHLASGRYLIGLLGGTCAYGAVAPVFALIDGQSVGVLEHLAFAAITGSIAGPALSLNLGIFEARVHRRRR